jgi:hypothetical protein
MWFLYIKHEHSYMSFKNNVSYVWIFKILNIYTNIIHINHSMGFMWFLYKPMKTSAHNLYEPMKLGKFVMIGY